MPRNWDIDDVLNRGWIKMLPRIRQAQGAGKKAGHFVTLTGSDGEQRVVFIGGPSQGGGYATGRAYYETVGGVGKVERTAAMAEFHSLPGWATEGVREVKLVKGPGYEFEAGGQHFQSGGSWNKRDGRITVYDVASEAPSSYSYVLAHEVGHNLFDRWWDDALKQEEAVYRDHPDWFHRFGTTLPERREDYAQACPLAVARDKFIAAWDAGQDGITNYSKAWAKEFKKSETVAEMARLFFDTPFIYGEGFHLRTRMQPVFSAAREFGAETLAEAFMQMVSYYEANQ